MPRDTRLIIPNICHHALQRGNNRQDVFHDNDDRLYSYKEFFYEEERHEELEAIRKAAQQGKAWGRLVFLEKLADSLDRIVVPRKRGRPKKENK